MIVSIQVEFAVEPLDDDGFSKQVAEDAAEQAAFDYLAFVKVSGYSTDSDEVEVHVDGFGKCKVRLANG